MNNEMWRPIVGFPKYEVSNTGKVRSLDYRHTGVTKELRQKTDKDGYKAVRLFWNGKDKHFLVHRIVAMAFIDNPNDLPQINHIDENKGNNNIDNLEWCTAKHNNNHGTKKQRLRNTLSEVMPEKLGQPIVCVETGVVYKTIAECGEKMGLDPGNISHVLRGHYKQTNGYTFKRR